MASNRVFLLGLLTCLAALECSCHPYYMDVMQAARAGVTQDGFATKYTSPSQLPGVSGGLQMNALSDGSLLNLPLNPMGNDNDPMLNLNGITNLPTPGMIPLQQYPMPSPSLPDNFKQMLYMNQNTNPLSYNDMSYVPNVPAEMGLQVQGERFRLKPQSLYFHDLSIPQEFMYQQVVDGDYYLSGSYGEPLNLATVRPEMMIFIKWIGQQLEILKTKGQAPCDMDYLEVSNAVLQLLRNNGIYLSQYGVLMDRYGNMFNIQTLTFTPIIIRNTLPLRRFLLRNYRATTFKWLMPYLHAILVTTSNPLKILGVIPVGTTYLPMSSVSHLINIPKVTSYIYGNKYNGVVPSLSPANDNYNLFGNVKPTIVSSGLVPSLTNDNYQLFGSANPSLGSTSFGNRLPKPIGLNMGKLQSHNMLANSASRTDDVDVVTIFNRNDDLVGGDDLYDEFIRIIGGNPAVGSGIPVSNKGRSGIVY